MKALQYALDRAVARAAGDEFWETNDSQIMGHPADWGPKYSADWTLAMQAAEKSGLWSVFGFSIETDGEGWNCLKHVSYSEPMDYDRISHKLGLSALTGPMAVCFAILENKNTDRDFLKTVKPQTIPS